VDCSRVVDNSLVGDHNALVQVDGDCRIVECESPVNALPRLMVDGTFQVITFGVGGAGYFVYKINGGFLNKDDVSRILSRV
jgi:hypothetical protein